ncbi:MAG TPA: penicillin-binding transpeptidase domain-containing protein [Bacillota bacterium]|nr:penicillin-binding transpeptidase domain-containing protein [Bacillota bacterium]
MEAAIALVDYHNGEIKALVGGREEEGSKRGFNRATDARRQPGSTFKPLAAYGPALEENYPPYMVLTDEPVRYGKYTPKNYGGGYRGDMRMSTALKLSVNVWAVKLLDLIGVEKGYQFASRLGFNLVPEDKGALPGTGRSDQWSLPPGNGYRLWCLCQWRPAG